MATPQFNKGTTKVSYKVSLFFTPTTQQSTHDSYPTIPKPADPKSISRYVSVVPIDDINPRWWLEGLQHIYERDINIKNMSQPKKGIVSKKMIDLVGLIRASDL